MQIGHDDYLPPDKAFRLVGLCDAGDNLAHAALRDPDAFNQNILERVIRRGRVYISNASINGMFALRACVVNHRTTEADVKEIVFEVLAAAKDLEQ